jgi:simple sugar transport system permease protein
VTWPATLRSKLIALAYPLATLALGLLVGAIAVIIVGGNPIVTYKQLADGAGLPWLLQWLPGNPAGVTVSDANIAETNLISTIVSATPAILCGLSVGFAFRCGVFNIGAGGQLVIGAMASFVLAHFIGGGIVGLLIASVGGVLAGGLYGAIPGALRAYRGAHEVITTIMLNFIAIQIGRYLVGIGGPLQKANSGTPFSDKLPASLRWPQFWGEFETNQVHLGIFLALIAVVVYWVILERTTLGYEVKSVGHSPEAARYGGVSVQRAVVLSMGIAGAFAGLAGSGETLGHYYQLQENTLSGVLVNLGFTGIAVALLGRNTPIGIVLAALLFSALDSGARQLSGEIPAELARALATIIQGAVILFVGGEGILRWLFRSRPKRERTLREGPPPAVFTSTQPTPGERM